MKIATVLAMGLALALMGTVRISVSAQSVSGQVEQIADSVTALTNNIGIIGGFLVLFGMMLFVLGALVIHIFLDGRRRAKADETSRKDYQLPLGENRVAVTEFTKISRGAVYTQHQTNLFSKQFIAQLESTRLTAKENFTSLIEAVGKRFVSLEQNTAKSLDNFGTRITGSMGTQFNNLAEAQKKASEFWAEKHREAMIEVAEMNRKTMLEIAEKGNNNVQEVNKLTIATLIEMKIISPPATEATEPRTPTGTLPPVTESPDTEKPEGE